MSVNPTDLAIRQMQDRKPAQLSAPQPELIGPAVLLLRRSGLLDSLAQGLAAEHVRLAQALSQSSDVGSVPPTITTGRIAPLLERSASAAANVNSAPSAPAANDRAALPRAGFAGAMTAAAEYASNRGHEALLSRDLQHLRGQGVSLDPTQALDRAILEEYSRSRGPSELRRLVSGMDADEATLIAKQRLEVFAAPASPSGSVPEDGRCAAVVGVSAGLSPLTAKHMIDAQSQGHPADVTLDRSGAAQRRALALAGVERRIGMDRDEYPPATFIEGGAGASIRYIPPGDNRSAGAQIRNQMRNLPDGCAVRLNVVP